MEPGIIGVISVCVILGVIVAIAIGFVIYRVRLGHYKKFVLEKSSKIHKLHKLNKQYDFEKCDPVVPIYVRFDNRTTWNKTEPIDCMRREIRANLNDWKETKEKIEYNKQLKIRYDNDVLKIKDSFDEDDCEGTHFRYKKCLELEKELFKEVKLKPTTKIMFDVELNYISAKGQVNIFKRGKFGTEEFYRLLDSISLKRLSRETYESVVKGERALLTDSMRYDVLRRDGFRCKLCGLSAEDGVVLHVDHIIPVSKGGKTTMSNLRTLCERCNMGKSNKIE